MCFYFALDYSRKYPAKQDKARLLLMGVHLSPIPQHSALNFNFHIHFHIHFAASISESSPIISERRCRH